MYSGIQCLHNLSNADINLSVGALPPKSEQGFVSAIGDYSVVRANAQSRFVSLGAAKHNLCELLLALSLVNATPTISVRLVQVDRPFKTFQVMVRPGISELLFFRGDYCVSSQLRLDLMSGFRILRRCLGLFCKPTSCPEVHNLRANARSG